MDRIEFSEKYFKELFGNDFDLKDTDPEFNDIVKRFVFGDVPLIGNLSKEIRELITIALLTKNQQLPLLEIHIIAALNIGVTPVKIKEIIYQTTPYIGIPPVVMAIRICNEVFKQKGIVLPIKSQNTVTEDTRYDRGLNLQVELFGEGMKSYKDNTPEGQKHIPQFLSEYCFGDFYTRDGLDINTRELLTMCVLASLGDTEPQMKAHINANLNIGNDKSLLISALAQCLPYIGFPRTLNAMRYLNEVTSK